MPCVHVPGAPGLGEILGLAGVVCKSPERTAGGMHCQLLLTVSSNGGAPAVLAVVGDSNDATSVGLAFPVGLELYSLN